MKKLPGRDTQRTTNRIALHFSIHCVYNSDKGLDIIEGNAPYGISTNNRITKALLKEFRPIICKPHPIKTALKYNRFYQQHGSMTAVANELVVSRVRVHQMLNLLNLDQRIIEYLTQMTVPKEINYWTERKLRNLLKLTETEQFTKFKKMICRL